MHSHYCALCTLSFLRLPSEFTSEKAIKNYIPVYLFLLTLFTSYHIKIKYKKFYLTIEAHFFSQQFYVALRNYDIKMQR